MHSPLRKIINRLSRKPNIKYLQVWQRDLREDIPTLPCDIQYAFVRLPQDVEAIEKRVANLPFVHRNDIPDRVAAYHKCCIATHGGETVDTAWLGVGYAYSYFLDRRFELADDEIYFYGAYTIPEYRSLGVHTSVRSRALQMASGSYKRVVAFIEPYNLPAVKSIKKLSYEYFGRTGYVEIAEIRYYFHRDKGAFSKLSLGTIFVRFDLIDRYQTSGNGNLGS